MNIKYHGGNKMVNVQLISYKICRLDMYNDLESDQGLKIQNWFEFDVTFDIENNIAEAILTEHLKQAEDPSDFGIDLTLKGIFHITGVKSVDSKKEAHIKCYDELFPYAGQVISHLAMNSGMSGLLLKKNPLKLESVNFGEKPEKERNDKIIEFRV